MNQPTNKPVFSIPRVAIAILGKPYGPQLLADLVTAFLTPPGGQGRAFTASEMAPLGEILKSDFVQGLFAPTQSFSGESNVNR